MFGLGAVEAVILLALLVPYFIPSLIAGARRHRNLGWIVMLNLFFGWTVVGWIGALVWSCAGAPHNDPSFTRSDP